MKKVVYRGKIEKGVKRLISWYSLNAHLMLNHITLKHAKSHTSPKNRTKVTERMIATN
jgi:hypothetical protein